LARLIDVQPSAQFLRHGAAEAASASKTSAAALLGRRFGPKQADHDSAPGNFQKIAAIDIEPIARRLEQFVAFGLQGEIAVQRRIGRR
jgi:hypothetical protein